MRFFDKIYKLMNYAGATREEYESIAADVYAYNRKRLLAFSGITIFFLTVMTIITILNPRFGFVFWIYLIPLAFIWAIHLTVRFLAKNRLGLLKASVYTFISLLYLMAIYIGAIASKAQTAGTFLAFLLAIPMLFVMQPWKILLTIILYDALFIFMVFRVKSSAVIAVDVINALVFGGISVIVSTFMMTTVVENLVMKHRLTLLAERDQLTKLRNRTSYEHRIPKYPIFCKKCLACIYADANGLHELNEVGGHTAGDDMLKFVAEALRELFGEEHAYRIGGDEFVAFAMDVEEAELQDRLRQLAARVEAAGYYVSVGYGIQNAKEIDMTALIRNAEERMYQAKTAFYQKTGKRRHRS